MEVLYCLIILFYSHQVKIIECLIFKDANTVSGTTLTTDNGIQKCQTVLHACSFTSGMISPASVSGVKSDSRIETKGEKGSVGPEGLPGIPGKDGEKGETGIGTKGDKGSVGLEGTPGTTGKDGEKGETGIGTKGDKGSVGPEGLPGIPGKDGEKGETGIGTKGDKGSVGPEGLPGISGKDGEKGETGIGTKGEKGSVGPEGPPGIPGKDGEKGETGIGTKGDKGSAGTPGEKGEIGQQGPQGQTGTCICPKTTYIPEEDDTDDDPQRLVINSCVQVNPNGLYQMRVSDPFEIVCNHQNMTCIPIENNISADNVEEKALSHLDRPFWTSEAGLNFDNLYNDKITMDQLQWLREKSSFITQKIRYHCKNSIVRNSIDTQSLKVFTWNEGIMGPNPSDSSPYVYTVNEATDGCKDTSNSLNWGSSDIELHSSTKTLPVIDFRISDIRKDKEQKFYIELLELCFKI